jgi:hypothetical protein
MGGRMNAAVLIARVGQGQLRQERRPGDLEVRRSLVANTALGHEL